MQRKFEEARKAYQQVLLVQNQKYWHSAALLQIGHCCEAMQDGQGARDVYTSLVRDFGDSPFANIAKTRLSLLPNLSLANQLEQESSGTKR
jgi:TolA-binding protein